MGLAGRRPQSSADMVEIWDLWFPNAGATGLSFARCRVGADAAADRVLVHAAPRRLEARPRPH
jgi:hypothetical protein